MMHCKTAMHNHSTLTAADVRTMIRRQQIRYGNRRLKVYGLLRCSSGRRMKRENRIFFLNEEEAILVGFRPCAHFIQKQYAQWKSKNRVE